MIPFRNRFDVGAGKARGWQQAWHADMGQHQRAAGADDRRAGVGQLDVLVESQRFRLRQMPFTVVPGDGDTVGDSPRRFGKCVDHLRLPAPDLRVQWI